MNEQEIVDSETVQLDHEGGGGLMAVLSWKSTGGQQGRDRHIATLHTSAEGGKSSAIAKE